MSRSRRKSPCKSWTRPHTMKMWRRTANKRFRSAFKKLLARMLAHDDWDNFKHLLINECSNIYDSPIDGRLNWQLKPYEEYDFSPEHNKYILTKRHGKPFSSYQLYEMCFRK